MKIYTVVALILGALGVGVAVGYFVFQFVNSPSQWQNTTISQNLTQSPEDLGLQNSTQPQNQKNVPSQNKTEPKIEQKPQ